LNKYYTQSKQSIFIESDCWGGFYAENFNF
jgi:hypothetical protein